LGIFPVSSQLFTCKQFNRINSLNNMGICHLESLWYIWILKCLLSVLQ
jgi:hypothetical protein